MKTKLTKIGRSLLKMDLFGESIGFKIDGEESRRSILGLMLSLGIFATILPYAVKKWQVMINYDDTDISETVKPNGLFLDGGSDKIDDLNISFWLDFFSVS